MAFFCYHLIVIAVNEKIAAIIVEFINEPIASIFKPGRKKKLIMR